jgi:hypothetical protein
MSSGQMDVVSDIAFPLPAKIIAAMLVRSGRTGTLYLSHYLYTYF